MKIIYAMLALLLLAQPVAAQMNGKFDSKQPIEISADSLEVLQNEQKAIFKGNVVAIQGQVRLKADQMLVAYKQNAEGKNSISKIEVTGNVFLATPEETASGAKGIYNVDAKQIDLVGGVTLTRGPNVLKGSALTYNLATGKSVVSGGGDLPGVKQQGGRVKGLFVPSSQQ